MSAKDEQIGGSHYKDMKIQPFEYITANNIPWADGCIIKYVSRWRQKGGVEDLKKARHFIDLLIEGETEEINDGELKVGDRVEIINLDDTGLECAPYNILNQIGVINRIYHPDICMVNMGGHNLAFTSENLKKI